MQELVGPLHPFGHGGDLETAAEAVGLAADKILDFSANLNPLGPPAGLYAFLAESLPQITSYPDPACRRFCKAVRKRYQPAHPVVPGNGAGELIYLLMRALPPGPALLPAPTFALYAKAAQAAGREVYHHFLRQEDGFRLDTDALCRHILQIRPASVILCNPNNPTGVRVTRNEILCVARTCAKTGTVLVVDEAFLEFCPDWHERTMLRQTPDNVAVLCSLTKLFAIPGLRLGFLAAPPSIADNVQRARDPWSVNMLAQLAGEFVLRDESYVGRTVEATAGLSRELSAALAAVPGLVVYPPAANYIFLQSKTLLSHVLQYELLKLGVLIRDCGNYAGLGPEFFRVAVRLPQENRVLVDALKTVLEGSDEVHLGSPR